MIPPRKPVLSYSSSAVHGCGCGCGITKYCCAAAAASQTNMSVSVDQQQTPVYLRLRASSEEPRPSWSCEVDIDTEPHPLHDCTFPTSKSKLKSLAAYSHREACPRSVLFQPSSTLFLYEGQECALQELWYTKADEDIFKAAAKKQVAAFHQLQMKSGESVGPCCFLNQGGLCIVGLERDLLSPEISEKRVLTKRLIKCAVLVEQARRGPCSSNKAERIAYAAMRHSEWSSLEATAVGAFQYRQSRA